MIYKAFNDLIRRIIKPCVKMSVISLFIYFYDHRKRTRTSYKGTEDDSMIEVQCFIT